jgi:hypothetical protein
LNFERRGTTDNNGTLTASVLWNITEYLQLWCYGKKITLTARVL